MNSPRPSSSSTKITIDARKPRNIPPYVLPSVISGVSGALLVVICVFIWNKYKNRTKKITDDNSTTNYNLNSDNRFSTANADSVISVQSGKSVEELALECNNTPGCIGFDSTGVLKSCQDQLVSESGAKTYLRKGTNPTC